jgi:very-short-patch-repair endonuclease
MARTPYAHWDEQKPLRRGMRKKPTAMEDALWAHLRNRRLGGAKFRRQHPIDHFIVDFYCAGASLAVELDGPIHERTSEADALRQAYLEGLGLHFLRFTNTEVKDAMDRVLATIAQHIKTNIHPEQ